MWVPKMRGFTKYPNEEFLVNQRFWAREASHPCNHASRGRDSSYLGSFSFFELRKKGFCFRVWLGEGKIGFSSSSDVLFLGVKSFA